MTQPLQYQQHGFVGTSVSNNAYQTMQNRNNLQASLAGVSKGGYKLRLRKKYGGASSTITVPNVPNTNLMNDPSSGTKFGVGNQITGVVNTNAIQSAQSANNHKVQLDAIPKGTTIVKGGRRTKRRGGFVWPCLSGGKRKSRKSRKTSKKNKSRKSRKSRK